MLIIPAIDLRGGRCVRLTQGNYDLETVYEGYPEAVAASFVDAGATWIHVVDLEGAKSGQPANLGVLEKILSSVEVAIEFGGGVRSRDAVARVLDMGVRRVVLGTAIARDRELAKSIFAEFGDRVVAGIDARAGKVAVAGWEESTSHEAVGMALSFEKDGARRLIVTDIGRDGTLQGPNLSFLEAMTNATTLPVIASGGVSAQSDLEALVEMNRPNLEAVIVGKAIYEGRLDLAKAILAGSN